MSNAHRGLPPPLGLSLPNPERHVASSALQSNSTTLDQITQPSQWQSSDASAQAWLQAKVEEERRRQEEERTRQEGLRLEQRKIEQSMLRESLQGGVPPHLVPIVFAGLGSTALTNMGIEWTQQHIAQAARQINQQPQFQPSQPQEDAQSRIQAAQILPDKSQVQQRQVDAQRPMPPIFYPTRPLDHGGNDTQIRSNPQTGSTFVSGTPNAPHNSLSLASVGQAVQTPKVIERNENSMFRGDRTPIIPPFSNTSGGGHAQRQTTLSHLNSGDMRTHPPPRTGHSMSSQQLALQQQQSSGVVEGNAGSPSIYFHHWIPPGAKDNNANNRQQQSQQESPKAPISGTSPGLRADYESSPKKRKTATIENDIQQHASTNIHQTPRRTFSNSRESRWNQHTELGSRSSSRSPRRQSRHADNEARREVLLPQG